MRGKDATPFLVGFWATSLGTLASRVLGTLRDVATAALLGLAAGGVMDAFVLAFRLPNLLRRLLGEGALASSYLPVLTAELERDRQRAVGLATAVVTWLAACLTVLLILGEGCCALAWLWSSDPSWRLLVGLTAAMLPYLWFICLAAQLSATLHALSRFTLPALSAGLLNVGWLAGAWWIAATVSTNKITQAYALAGCVVAAGALQMAVQLPLLWRLGFRWRLDWQQSRAPCWKILRSMGPLAIALSVTQINTLVDSLVAWGLTAPAGKVTIGWLPGAVEYPLRAGATAALYYAERFYQLPVGLLGVAVATVIFPLLSRHAAQGRRIQLSADLVRGLRLICFTSLPAAVGLILLAWPLAGLLFEHGAFTGDDAMRTARTIATYSLGVCSYCLLPVIARGFYAAGDMRTPLTTSLIGMGINVTLDLALVWPLGECGLALATAISASVQAFVMARLFSQLHGPLDWRPLHSTYAKTTCATALMGMAVLVVPYLLPAIAGRWHELLHVTAGVLTGAGVFLLTARLLGCDELALLWPRGSRRELGPVPPSLTSPDLPRAAGGN
jgi:putative peptidoglycan lipid II flippase